MCLLNNDNFIKKENQEEVNRTYIRSRKKTNVFTKSKLINFNILKNIRYLFYHSYAGIWKEILMILIYIEDML